MAEQDLNAGSLDPDRLYSTHYYTTLPASPAKTCREVRIVKPWLLPTYPRCVFPALCSWLSCQERVSSPAWSSFPSLHHNEPTAATITDGILVACCSCACNKHSYKTANWTGDNRGGNCADQIGDRELITLTVP